jgi:hypothetical protein
MISGDRSVLVIPAESRDKVELYRLLMPSMVRFGCSAHSVPDGTNASQYLEENAFDVIVIDFPDDKTKLPALLKSIRWRESASRRAGVLLVTTQVARRRAEPYLKRGVSRIVFDDATDWEIEGILGDLLQVERRVDVNTTVKLDLPLAGKTEHVMAQVVNVSTSGMLIRGHWDVEMNAPVTFEFTPPDSPQTLRGTAEVVRPTVREREGLVGFAVRFVSFENQDRQLLDQFIQSRAAEPGLFRIGAEDNAAAG